MQKCPTWLLLQSATLFSGHRTFLVYFVTLLSITAKITASVTPKLRWGKIILITSTYITLCCINYKIRLQRQGLITQTQCTGSCIIFLIPVATCPKTQPAFLFPQQPVISLELEWSLRWNLSDSGITSLISLLSLKKLAQDDSSPLWLLVFFIEEFTRNGSCFWTFGNVDIRLLPYCSLSAPRAAEEEGFKVAV